MVTPVIEIVKDAVRKDIAAGKFPEGSRLPGFRELSQKYACSRGTIENAIRSLADDGIVYTTRGRGTFLAGTKKHTLRRSSRIVGAVLLRSCWLEAMESLRRDYLKKGWFVSTYCATDDLQDPAAEADFLNLALEQHFAAVLLVGSPKKPSNADLYKKLRREGMKVLHLSHYQKDMSRENAVLPDYEAAGRLAVSKVGVHGFRKLYYVNPPVTETPSVQLRLSGVREMASGLELTLHELTQEEAMKKKLPSDGIFLFDSPQAALQLKTVRKNARILTLSGSVPEAIHFDRISFDYQESIRLAMEYVMDETIPATAPYCKMLSPKFYTCNIQ